MNLDIGTKERFLSYIHSLSKDDVIALISHTDLDGVAAALVTQRAIQAHHVYFVNYDDINAQLVKELREKKVTKAIFTDLFIGKKDGFLSDLEQFAEVLVLDHHLVSSDDNSTRTTYIKGEDGYCAAFLCYELFSSIASISDYDWIVACACISDYCYEKNVSWMESIFANYGQKFSPLTLRQSSFWSIQWTLTLALIYFKDNTRRVYDSIGTTFGDIGNLRAIAQKVQDELDILIQKFLNERKRMPGGWYWEFSPHYKLTSLISTIVSGSEEDKTYVLVRLEGSYAFVSARRQDKKVSMVELLKRSLEGMESSSSGGHIPAAGGRLLKRDVSIFRERLGVAG